MANTHEALARAAAAAAPGLIERYRQVREGSLARARPLIRAGAYVHESDRRRADGSAGPVG